MRAEVALLELGYLPMVVASGPDPPREQAESLQAAARAVRKAFVYISHIAEGLQVFDV